MSAAGARSAPGGCRPSWSATSWTPVGQHQLDGLQPGQPLPQPGDRGHRLGHAGQAQTRGHAVLEARDQAQPRRGDHRQGPLAAGQQAGEVVAGVVLGQPGQVGHHAPVAQHRLDAGHLGPHRAVAHHMDPAGVRGDHPADRARVPRRQVDAEGQPGRVGVGLQPGQRDAGPGGHLRGGAVDVAELVEPAQAEHQLTVERDPATDQAGVAPLGDDGDAGPRAGPHDGRDLLGRPRPDHRRRPAPEAARPVDGVPRGHFGVGQDLRRPDHVLQLRDEVGGQGGRGHGP